MQGGVGHRDAADEYRCQPRYRRQRAGAPHLHVDIEHLRQRFFGREFMCNGEARRACDETEFLLQCQVVDFVHHAVDVIWQLPPLRADLLVIRQQSIHALDYPTLAGHRQVQRRQLLHGGSMRRGHFPAIHRANAIREKMQWPRRRDARIKLAQRTGCGVARVGEFLVAACALLGIECFEIGLKHQHFAAHFE